MALGATRVYEAKRWVEKAPGGGSQAQVFQLRDGRHVVVKFPENPQGERVLVNEFLSCALAEMLQLSVNQAVLVSIDERLLSDPQSRGECPATFTAGIRCGMLRVADAVIVNEQQLAGGVINYGDIHSVAVFDALVARGDGRQLLAYPEQPNTTSPKRFVAIDYGFAFGGSPVWTVDSFRAQAAPVLPQVDLCTGKDHGDDGTLMRPIVDKLRALSGSEIFTALGTIYAPRWGVAEEEIAELALILAQRRTALVEQFDIRFVKQLEAFK